MAHTSIKEFNYGLVNRWSFSNQPVHSMIDIPVVILIDPIDLIESEIAWKISKPEGRKFRYRSTLLSREKSQMNSKPTTVLIKGKLF